MKSSVGIKWLVMKKLSSLFFFLILVGCEKEFEPPLTGWRANTIPRTRLHLRMDGRDKMINLPGDTLTGYRYPQWTKSAAELLLVQTRRTQTCYDFQIVSVDTTGVVLDTVYTAPSNVALNFKLAPNDSLLLMKTYRDNCEDSDDYRYTFYNRFSQKALADTIRVRNARGIPLLENLWSPNSRRVLIPNLDGRRSNAFVYDLVTKDSTYIDEGSNFVWSPSDTSLVTYIKDYSIYGKNVDTGESQVIFEGKKKRSAAAFRWSPAGDYLLIHIRSYLLNIESGPTTATRIIYYSIEDKMESRTYFDDERVDSWKDPSIGGNE
jgi:hypothetical protein